MDRLQTELQRLFFPPGSQGADTPGPAASVDPTRAVVLSLARPASWEALKTVWQGAQADLQLPAPAIAVTGVDALELWFAIAEPVPAAQAVALGHALRERYLGAVAAGRVGVTPVTAQAPVAPPIEASPDRWSAFVAPDLASLFEGEPWLDLPPGRDAQADLLSRIQAAKPGDWRRAIEQLAQAEAPAPTATSAPTDLPQEADPRRFLAAVMNDPSIDIRWRIEAAKALLPGADARRGEGSP